MKVKQINNDVKPSGRSVNHRESGNLSPPENRAVKELTLCVDVRNYSWQVAPLQSLFTLHSGKNECNMNYINQRKYVRLKHSVDKYFSGIESHNM